MNYPTSHGGKIVAVILSTACLPKLFSVRETGFKRSGSFVCNGSGLGLALEFWPSELADHIEKYAAIIEGQIAQIVGKATEIIANSDF